LISAIPWSRLMCYGFGAGQLSERSKWSTQVRFIPEYCECSRSWIEAHWLKAVPVFLMRASAKSPTRAFMHLSDKVLDEYAEEAE